MEAVGSPEMFVTIYIAMLFVGVYKMVTVTYTGLYDRMMSG
jgi:hypothetical protein